MATRVKLQSESSALLLGAGYVAQAMIGPLRKAGYSVIATNRSGQDVPNADATLKLDAEITSQIKSAFEAADIILTSIPPRGDKINALSKLTPRARWIGYLSATSVYGDRSGKWAFEGEAPTPGLKRGFARAEAEINWVETGWPVHIFRLAGIYGPPINEQDRAPFRRLQNGQARAVIKPGHVVNRIHVADIVSALMASIANPNPQRIYNIADGHPAPPQDVLDFAADLAGLPRAKRITADSADLSDMARSFYAESKRVDISRAQAELGWSPHYEDYKAGLRAVWQAISRRKT